MQNINFSLKPVGRGCDGCTKCCDGWLTGEAYGLHFYPGRPCYFKSSTGCMIYLTRPKDPCVSFECEWKRNANIPEWIKPNLSNIIIVQRYVETIPYWGVSQAGRIDQEKVNQWLTSYHKESQRNILFWTEPINQIFTTDSEFVTLIQKKFPNSKFSH